jgi:hypothetical protein
MNDRTYVTQEQIEVALETAKDKELIAELESRGFRICDVDVDELATLHDNFYRDPERAVDAVRKWLLRATGRVG